MSNKKKKIILAVSNDLVSDNRVHKISTTLVEEGFQVLVIGRKLSYSQELPTLPYATKRLRLFFTKGSLFYAELNIRLFLFLLFQKADIFTANDLDTLLGVFCAAKIRNKKIVYDSHEYFTEVPELEHNPKAKKVWTSIEKMIFPKLKFCMTVCQSIATVYQEKYGVSVSVVRNVPFYQKNEPATISIEEISKPFILYQGAVNLGRGLELMIDAMQCIQDAQLLIIGSGDKLEELKQKVFNLQLQHKVIFLGRIHFSQLPLYTHQATIGISIEENIGLNYYYALPNKLFDYIQAHKPMIVSDLPEMKRIIDEYECGEILQQRNPESLALQINNLLNNKLLQEKYSNNAKSASKILCWEKEKEILLALYQ